MALMDKAEIEKIIPHRDPFLLLDTVEELEPGVRCVATKWMAPDSFWFAGHYPGHPVTPGVLMIEMLAQACGVCAMSAAENRGGIPLFAGVDKARFRRQVEPGDTLRLEVELTKDRGALMMAKGKATVNGERAVTCEMTFAFAPADAAAKGETQGEKPQ